MPFAHASPVQRVLFEPKGCVAMCEHCIIISSRGREIVAKLTSVIEEEDRTHSPPQSCECRKIVHMLTMLHAYGRTDP